jgi:hypothetical protein
VTTTESNSAKLDASGVFVRRIILNGRVVPVILDDLAFTLLFNITYTLCVPAVPTDWPKGTRFVAVYYTS